MALNATRVFARQPGLLVVALLFLLGLPASSQAASRDLQIRFRPSPGAVAYKVHIGIGPRAYIRVDEFQVADPSSDAPMLRRVPGLPDDLAVYLAVSVVTPSGETLLSNELIMPASRPGGMCFFDTQCFNGRPVACVNMRCGGPIPLGIDAFASNVAAPQSPGKRVMFGVQGKGGSGRYEFAWYHRVNGGPWVRDRDFSKADHLSLTLPNERGLVEIAVMVRNEGDASTLSPEAMHIYPYRVS